MAEEATVHSPLPRRTTLLSALLVACTAACTGACTGGSVPEPSEGSSTGSAALSPAPSAAPPARPRSVPMVVAVTHVAGRLDPSGRTALARTVGRTISSYVDAAFLGGDYPRTQFAGSFASFTPGAAREARGDLALLTNQPLGATTRSVRATRRTAYLSVLAPRQRTAGRRVAGVVAAVDLVFDVDREPEPVQRVEMRGRLLLTRDRSGAWKIFGYDLTRSPALDRAPKAPGTPRPSAGAGS